MHDAGPRACEIHGQILRDVVDPDELSAPAAHPVPGMLQASHAPGSAGSERQIPPFLEQPIRLHFPFEAAVPVIRNDQNRCIVFPGIIDQLADGVVQHLERLFHPLAAPLVAPGPPRIDVPPGLVLKVVRQLQHNHEHVPSVPLPAELRDRHALMETTLDVVEILLKDPVTTEEPASPLGPQRGVRPTLKDLLLEIRRIYEIGFRPGSLKTTDQKPVDGKCGERHGDVDTADLVSLVA